MSCVFIFSNTFSAKTLICNLNYLLNNEINEIVLLSENHRASEYNNKYDNLKISIFDTIYDCVSKSDLIIILQNTKMPQHSISIIKSEAERTNKKCFMLEDVWETATDNILHKREDINFNNYPVILHISLGSITQTFCTEIELNKVMGENNIKIKQIFSDSTFDLLLQMKDCGILNNTLIDQVNQNTQLYNIVIYSIDIGLNINNIIEYMEIFKLIRADYVILQVDRNFDDYENSFNMIKYCCFSKMDKIIKSHFTRADGKYNLYCNDKLDISDNVYDVESKELGSLLFHSIASKLSLPKGIYRM